MQGDDGLDLRETKERQDVKELHDDCHGLFPEPNALRMDTRSSCILIVAAGEKDHFARSGRR